MFVMNMITSVRPGNGNRLELLQHSSAVMLKFLFKLSRTRGVHEQILKAYPLNMIDRITLCLGIITVGINVLLVWLLLRSANHTYEVTYTL